MTAVASTGFSTATLLGSGTGLAVGDPSVALPGTGGIDLITGERLPGGSVPGGVESVLEYNGIYLNVRDWVDTFLVTNIGGIDDADVRDSREVNPGYHGETPFKGYYGGRTITLSGKVYAHTLFKLRDMQKGLRQAFAQLDHELPLIFRHPDPSLDMQIMCKKSQAIQMAEEQRTANHFERAFLITLRASNPRFLSVVKVHAPSSFTSLYDFSASSPVITKEAFDSSSVLSLYNAKGDGFKVESGLLRSNGKPNIYNIFVDPDFKSPSTVAGISATDCVLSRSTTGGAVDGEGHGIVTVNADNCYVQYDYLEIGPPYSPVPAGGMFFSCSFMVRSPGLPCNVTMEIEWRDTPTTSFLPVVTTTAALTSGQWQEVKLENLYAPEGAVAARVKLIFSGTSVGNEHHIDKLMLVNGETLPVGGYFDGDHPLAKWTGAQFTSKSVLYPYTILTTNRSLTKPMMTVKVNMPTIDGTHPWGNPDVRPEGMRIVLAYEDDGNQIYVTFKDRAGSNLGDFILVIWRNGEREVYDVGGETGMSITNMRQGDTWWRAFMKNGEVVVEWWRIDPYSGAVDGFKEWDYWKLTPEQVAAFEKPWPMQLVVFDENYGLSSPISLPVYQDTWRLDDFTYQSIDDLREWDYLTASSGVLNPTPLTFSKSSVYVKGNKLYSLWDNNAFLLRNDLPYLMGDGSITYKVRYEDPIGTSMIQVGIVGKYIDSNNFIYADLQIYSATNMTIHIVAVVGSGTFNFSNYLDFVKTDFPEDADRWLRLVMNGNTFTVEFWTTDPALGGAAARSRSGTLTGAGIAMLGAGVKGRVGLMALNMIPSSYIDDYSVIQSSFGDLSHVVSNDGNFRAQPVFELVGPLTNLILTNETNDEWMSIPTTIPGGETWVVDIEDRRMYRKSDDANRFQYLDANSDWMELEPGENQITATATGMTATSQVNIDYHHTVM